MAREDRVREFGYLFSICVLSTLLIISRAFNPLASPLYRILSVLLIHYSPYRLSCFYARISFVPFPLSNNQHGNVVDEHYITVCMIEAY